MTDNIPAKRFRFPIDFHSQNHQGQKKPFQIAILFFLQTWRSPALLILFYISHVKTIFFAFYKDITVGERSNTGPAILKCLYSCAVI